MGQTFRKVSTSFWLEAEDEVKQLNTLIYAMGDEADDKLKYFQLAIPQRKKYDTVKETFGDYFVVKPNVIFEKVKFNTRVQAEGKTVDKIILGNNSSRLCLAFH